MASRPPRQKAKNDARQQLWYRNVVLACVTASRVEQVPQKNCLGHHYCLATSSVFFANNH